MAKRQEKTFTKIVSLIEEECANYDGGTCLHLDCPCVQKISKCSFEDKGILMCKYFANNVLPLKPELYAEINKTSDVKPCKICGKDIAVTSNRSKYCSECAAEVHRKQNAAAMRKKRG